MALKSQHLLGIQDLASETILEVLHTAVSFREISQRKIKKVPTLRGRTVINAFSNHPPEHVLLLRSRPSA